MIRKNKQTHKEAIRGFLDKSKPELEEYVQEQLIMETITPEMRDFLINDIKNIFNYLYSKL